MTERSPLVLLLSPSLVVVIVHWLSATVWCPSSLSFFLSCSYPRTACASSISAVGWRDAGRTGAARCCSGAREAPNIERGRGRSTQVHTCSPISMSSVTVHIVAFHLPLFLRHLFVCRWRRVGRREGGGGTVPPFAHFVLFPVMPSAVFVMAVICTVTPPCWGTAKQEKEPRPLRHRNADDPVGGGGDGWVACVCRIYRGVFCA